MEELLFVEHGRCVDSYCLVGCSIIAGFSSRVRCALCLVWVLILLCLSIRKTLGVPDVAASQAGVDVDRLVCLVGGSAAPRRLGGDARGVVAAQKIHSWYNNR